jgi:hypothetical protein
MSFCIRPVMRAVYLNSHTFFYRYESEPITDLWLYLLAYTFTNIDTETRQQMHLDHMNL